MPSIGTLTQPEPVFAPIQEIVDGKTVLMTGENTAVTAISEQQTTTFLNDVKFGRSTLPRHIYIARKLLAFGITNADRIALLEVVRP